MPSLIVAYDENRVIGFQGTLPWHLPEDLRHFKEMTFGDSIILGRKTWEGFRKPLVGRDHYILTRKCTGKFFQLSRRVWEVSCLNIAIELAEQNSKKKIWIIGGSEVYKSALDSNFVTEIIATEVKGNHDGDTFFPYLTGNWIQSILEKHDLFNIVRYERRGQ